MVPKEDTSSTTVSTEGPILSCMIDAMEVQDVSTTDIQGSFLQTCYCRGYIHINMEGAMVTIIKEVD